MISNWGNIHAEYQYQEEKPHAVTKAGKNIYTYDANGNVKQRNGNEIEWTSFNLPSVFETPTDKIVEFSYTPLNDRYSKVLRRKDKWHNVKEQETTHYIDKFYEKTTKPNGINETNYIYANGELIAIVFGSEISEDKSVGFIHKDLLGSIDSITGIQELLLESRRYSSYGKCQLKDNKTEVLTNRGFTGHEGIAGLDLVHMNGRVYDVNIGRFLSPDPFLNERYFAQSLNRYSYALNNPFKFTDPNGFFVSATARGVLGVIFHDRKVMQEAIESFASLHNIALETAADVVNVVTLFTMAEDLPIDGWFIHPSFKVPVQFDVPLLKNDQAKIIVKTIVTEVEKTISETVETISDTVAKVTTQVTSQIASLGSSTIAFFKRLW